MMRLAALLLACAGLLAASPRSAIVQPNVRVHRNPADWRIIRPHYTGPYSDIIVGPGPKIWISSTGANALLSVDLDGTTHRLPMDFDASTMTEGPDGRIYMTQTLPDSEIAAITTGGVLSRLYLNQSPSNDVFNDTALAPGADGNVWFGETQHLASLSPTGTVTEYRYNYGEIDNEGVSLFRTPTRLYYTVCCQLFRSGAPGFVGYFDFQLKQVSELPLTDPACGAMSGVAIGGDGKLYVLCTSTAGTQALLQISGIVNAKITKFPFLGPISTSVDAMIVGPDGDIWFTPGADGALVRFDSVARAFDEYFTPGGNSPLALTVGPDNNIWTISKHSVDVFLTSHR
jgi:hypothetical protein